MPIPLDSAAQLFFIVNLELRLLSPTIFSLACLRQRNSTVRRTLPVIIALSYRDTYHLYGGSEICNFKTPYYYIRNFQVLS